MKYFKIKDSTGNLHIIEAASAIDAVKKVADKARSQQKIIIGVKDSVEYSYYNGRFYANDTRIDDKLILESAKEGKHL